MDLFDLTGKVAVVTGSSRGIGRAIAGAALRRVTPLGRIGEPDEVAGVAVFLASRVGAYVTGRGIVVDGGATIRGGY